MWELESCGWDEAIECVRSQMDGVNAKLSYYENNGLGYSDDYLRLVDEYNELAATLDTYEISRDEYEQQLDEEETLMAEWQYAYTI